MTRFRLVRAGVALGGLAVAILAAPSSAAGARALSLTDPAGDANALNGQSAVAGLGDHTGPTQKADADILGVSFAASAAPGPDCDAFTVTWDLASPPGDSTMYRVMGLGRTNDRQFWVQHEVLPSGSATTLRYRNDERSGTLPITPAVVEGNRIRITVSGAELEKTGERLESFSMSRIGMDVRTSTGETTAPAWDTIDEDDKRTFAPCRRR